MIPDPKLLTIGEIARRMGVAPHRIAYAIDRYGIEPTQRAGIIRLFDEGKVEAIEWALRRVAGGPGGQLSC